MWFSPPVLGYWLGMLYWTYLAVVFVIDVEHRLVMHPISIFGALFSFGLGVWVHESIWKPMLGGLVGFGIMFVLYYLGVLFARWTSRRRGAEIEEGDALGFGDVILAGVLGLLLGYPLIFSGVLVAILLGGGISLLMILGMIVLKRYEAFAAIPYAPFLILSAVWLIYF